MPDDDGALDEVARGHRVDHVSGIHFLVPRDPGVHSAIDPKLVANDQDERDERCEAEQADPDRKRDLHARPLPQAGHRSG